MKHLLKLLDLSKEEIISILDLADQLKYEQKNHIPHKHLEGKTLDRYVSAGRLCIVSFFQGPSDWSR